MSKAFQFVLQYVLKMVGYWTELRQKPNELLQYELIRDDASLLSLFRFVAGSGQNRFKTLDPTPLLHMNMREF